MQFATTLIACLAIFNGVIAAPGLNTQLVQRQDPGAANPDQGTVTPGGIDEANALLNQARQDSVALIRGGGGNGRVLFECGTLCTQCQNGAVAVAVIEILGCGTAALGLEVLTAGLSTFLEVTGFLICNAAATANLVESEANCSAITDP